MIIFEWIYNYMTTPQISMTPQIEMLGLLGIYACLLLFCAIVYIISFIIDRLVRFTKKKKK